MTEFGKYLTQCPHALNSKTGTLGLLKDALQNDMPKFRVLQAAYELGILDALRKSNPLTAEDRMRILTGLSCQYAMTDSAAQKAVAYWQESITPDILKNAEKELVSCPTSENPATSPASFALPQRQSINIPGNRPTIISISQDTIRLGLRIQWKRQPGLQGYEVWRAKENEPPILVKSGSFPIPRYQDFDVAEGCLYTYAVRGILSGEDKTYTVGSNDMQLTAPKRKFSFQFIEAASSQSGIKLAWGFVFGSACYIVEKYDTFGNDWFQLAELPSDITQFVDQSAIAGESNRYQLICKLKDGTRKKSTAIDVNL